MAERENPLNELAQIVWLEVPDNITISDFSLDAIVEQTIFELSNPEVRSNPQLIMDTLEKSFRRVRRVRTQRRMDRDKGIKP